MSEENKVKSEINKDHWNDEIYNHEIKMKLSNGLECRAVTSQILLDSPDGKEKKSGKMSYTAYIHSGKDTPLFFCFNGGPGSASHWLHLGAFGPKTVQGLDVNGVVGDQELKENAHSLVYYGDTVFVDPVGTGFSEVKSDEIGKMFWNEIADAESIAQFICLYLNETGSWGKKIYLVGESYGGYRISLLSEILIQKYGIYCSGLYYVSPFISGVGIQDSMENVIAQGNFLVGYIQTAWYHKKSTLCEKIPTDKELFDFAHDFIYKEILPELLLKPLGKISEEKLQKCSDYMGIPIAFLREAQSHFSLLEFSRHLYYGENKYVGRIDSRFTSEQPLTFLPRYEDPSIDALDRSLTYKLNSYLRNEFGLKTKQLFVSISESVSHGWVFKDGFCASAMESLSNVMKKQKEMKVYVTAGYYDLAVPAATITYDIEHLNIGPMLRDNIKIDYFEAGHMMYVKESCLQKMTESSMNWFGIEKI